MRQDQGRPVSFALHPRLATDTIPLCELRLCTVLLLNDSRLPWCILVPRRDGIREIHELPADDACLLTTEVVAVSRAISTLFSPDKINVGALGNIVPQLHIHVIGRYATDHAWPGPAWGAGPAVPYDADAARKRIMALQDGIEGFFPAES